MESGGCQETSEATHCTLISFRTLLWHGHRHSLLATPSVTDLPKLRQVHRRDQYKFEREARVGFQLTPKSLKIYVSRCRRGSESLLFHYVSWKKSHAFSRNQAESCLILCNLFSILVHVLVHMIFPF